LLLLLPNNSRLLLVFVPPSPFQVVEGSLAGLEAAQSAFNSRFPLLLPLLLLLLLHTRWLRVRWLALRRRSLRG
jgi:hypothetical protein